MQHLGDITQIRNPPFVDCITFGSPCQDLSVAGRRQGLQGYPNGWTDIGEWVERKGKRRQSSDRARYKALGNSIALPQWWWITCKMAPYLPVQPTLGSLFDGIGGFPLVWETRYGPGTAVWASEIEPFPIAVTKTHFPGNAAQKE